MIVCKVCGTQNEAGASFCGSCGSYLEWNGEAYNADGSAKTTPAPPGAEQQAVASQAPAGQPAQPAVTPAPEADASAAGSVVCPNCGEANDPGRVFCRRCATELAATSAPIAPVAAAPPRRRSGPPVAVVGGVAAIAVLAVVAAFVVLPGGKPTASSATGTSVPSTSASAAPGASEAASAATPTDTPVAASPTPAGPTGVIVFSAGNTGEFNLFTWDAATREVSPLFESPGTLIDPSWSPDRSKVVYRDPSGLRIITADGKPATPPDFTHHAQDLGPAWSPDGSTIVFATNRSPLTSLDIYTRPANDNQAQIKSLVNSKADDWDPAWTPDGTRIVFATTRLGDARLFVMNADGSQETEIDLGPGVYDDPTVSPDGQWLAFTRRENKSANKVLWIAHLDGSAMRRMTNVDVNENDMSWSPDGRYLAVVRGTAGSTIVVIEVATGAEVTTFGVDGARALTPDWR